MNLPIVLGITGASGAVYSVRTLQWLIEEKQPVHLVVSSDGMSVLRHELGFLDPLNLRSLPALLNALDNVLSPQGQERTDQKRGLSNGVEPEQIERLVTIHSADDYFCSIASGSYRTKAMVVCPCSGSTLAAIAQANGRNLIHRAAEVHLKERRKLILVTRETPLSLIQIENMLRATQAGAVILPASPGWYHPVQSLRDLVDFIASRILDQLDIQHQRTQRWQADGKVIH